MDSHSLGKEDIFVLKSRLRSEGSTSKQMNGKAKKPMIRLSVNNIAILVRLSTAKTANAERWLAVCRLPFRPRCSSV